MPVPAPGICLGLRPITSSSSAAAIEQYNACIDARRTAKIAAMAQAAAAKPGAQRAVLNFAISPPVPALPPECRGLRAIHVTSSAADIAQFNACAAARRPATPAKSTSSAFDHSEPVPKPAADVKDDAKDARKPADAPESADAASGIGAEAAEPAASGSMDAAIAEATEAAPDAEASAVATPAPKPGAMLFSAPVPVARRPEL